MGEEGKAETQLLEVLNLVWSSFEFKKGVIVPVLLFFFSFLPISFLFIFGKETVLTYYSASKNLLSKRWVWVQTLFTRRKPYNSGK